MQKTTTLFFVLTIALLTMPGKAQNFVWAKQFEGFILAKGKSIKVDASGNVYTTGYFRGIIDFDPGSGVYNLNTTNQDWDIFITKLDAVGNFVWAKQMGGSGNDLSTSITIDASGNVYTTGYFNGTADFDPGSGNYVLTSQNNSVDIFVSKLNTAGNFVWAKQMGGSGSDIGTSITIDASGNVYTTGYFNGTADFDPGSGISNLISVGNSDVFVNKLNTAGNLVWVKQVGGTDIEISNSIEVDASGNVYTTGFFSGIADFDPGSGISNLTSSGITDIFVNKLNTLGNFVWVKQMRGSNIETSNSIKVDTFGNVYTTGYFEGTVDFDPGSGISNFTSVGSYDVFVNKLDAVGNLVWIKQIGGSGNDMSLSIELDASNNIYTVGSFIGTVDFDPGSGTTNLTSVGSYDNIFVNKLDNMGNLIWVKQMGSIDSSAASNSIDVDASGNVYTTGSFEGTVDFDPGNNVHNLTSTQNFLPANFNTNGFVHKMSPDLPTANFTFPGTICSGTSTTFTDISSNIPTSWLWTSSPSTGVTITTTSSQNPSINFTTAGTYTISLTAINGQGSNSISKTVTVTNCSSTCDTLNNLNNATQVVAYKVSGISNWGYVSGTNNYGDLAKAEAFSAPATSMKITAAIVWFAKAYSGSANSVVNVKVWGDNGSGAPGNVLSTEQVHISSITTASPVIINFTSPATVTGNYYVGIQWKANGAQQDTIVLYTNQDGDTNPGTAWELFSDGVTWSTYSASWNINVAHAIWVIRCPAPSSVEEINNTFFTVFPNPSSDAFYISDENVTAAKISVFDMLGNNLKCDIEREGNLLKIDLGNQPSGIYLIRLEQNNQISNTKLILSH